MAGPPPGASDEGRSYLQVGPPGNDRVGLDPVDDDELAATRRPGHDPDIPLGKAELVRDEPDECVVRRPLDGRRGDPDPEFPVDDAIDVVGCSTRSE